MKNFLKILVLGLLLITSNQLFSQTVILPDLITTGYFTVYQNNKFISNHTSQSKADIKIGMLKEVYPDSNNYFIPPTNVRAKGKLQVIDTIITNLRLDVDFDPVKPFRDMVVDGKRYILTKEEGLVEYIPDTTYNWQKKYRFLKTREFGDKIYKELDIPFQYIEVFFTKVNNTAYQMYARLTEPQAHIISYIDGVKHKEFTPGNYYAFESWYEYNFSVSYLVPETDYTFRLETTNDKGEVIVYETIIRI